MLLGKRLRVIREARKAFDDAVDSGLSKDEAFEETLNEMQRAYGADMDWMEILGLILKVLALFL
jgi:hypothetical protein